MITSFDVSLRSKMLWQSSHKRSNQGWCSNFVSFSWKCWTGTGQKLKLCKLVATLYVGSSSRIIRVVFSLLFAGLHYLIMLRMWGKFEGSPIAKSVSFIKPDLPIYDVKLFHQSFILCGNAKRINGALTKYSYICGGGCCQCFIVSCAGSSAIITSCVRSVNAVYL